MKDGLSHICKSCKSAHDKKHYRKYRDKILANVKLYTEHNNEKIYLYKKTYYNLYRDELLAEHKIYYDENRVVLCEKQKQRNRLNPDENRKRANQWYKDNPHRAKANVAKSDAKRRGLLKGKPIHKIDLPTLAERDNWRCHICEKKVTEESWSRDHLIPVSFGGPHTWDNVKLAHRVCNSRRNKGYISAQLMLFGLVPTD